MLLAVVWKWYVLFVGLPGRLPKTVGIGLYFLSLCVGVAFLTLSMSQTDRMYVSKFEIKSGTDVEHRVPDFLLCPSRPRKHDYKFNVWYNQKMIDLIGMPRNLVDKLTQMYHENQFTKADCNGKFAVFCEKVKMIWTNQTVLETMEGMKNMKDNIKYVLDHNNVKGMDLEFLFGSIIDPQYCLLHNIYMSMNSNLTSHMFPIHFYKNGAYDQKRVDSTKFGRQDIWLADMLCIVADNTKAAATTTTPYIGITSNFGGFAPLRYWFGSLGTYPLTETQLITQHHQISTLEKSFEIQERRASIVYYSVFNILETTAKTKCVDQPSLRGYKCVPEASGWYYDLSFDNNRQLDTLWFYIDTKETVMLAPTHTLYTRIQIAAGIVGTFVGLSFFQIVELGFSLAKQAYPNRRSLNVSRWLILFLIGATASALTILDIKNYFEGRYVKVFGTRELEDYPIPRIQLCSHGFTHASFWNTSKFHDFGISVAASQFLQLFGWNKKRSHSLPFNRRKPTANKMEILGWQLRNIHPELELNAEDNFAFSIPPDLGQTEDILTARKYNLALSTFFFDFAEVFYKEYFDEHPESVEYTMKGATFNASEFRRFTSSILEELSRMGVEMGIGDNPTFVELSRPFVLNPAELLKCTLGGKNVTNCGQHFNYYLIPQADDARGIIQKRSLCWVLEAKPSLGNITGTGDENGIDIRINADKYQRESDWNEYYGPGTEQEQKRDFPAGGCHQDSFKDWKFDCSISIMTSFEGILLHSSGGSDTVSLRLDPLGITGHNGFAVNLHSTHQTLLPGPSDCVLEKDAVCKQPDSDLRVIAGALEMVFLCGCANCPHAEPFLLRQIKTAIGYEVKCCGIKEITECYARYAERSDEGTTFLYLFHGSFRVTLKDWDSPQIATIFPQTKHLISNTTWQSILAFAEQCKKPRCDAKGLRSDGIQIINEKEMEAGWDQIKIFYGKPESSGTYQMDRLDTATLCGIFFCSLSITFGFCVMRLMEAIVSLFVGYRYGYDRRNDDTFLQHVLRKMGLFDLKTKKLNSGQKILEKNSVSKEGNIIPDPVAKEDDIVVHPVPNIVLDPASEEANIVPDPVSEEADIVPDPLSEEADIVPNLVLEEDDIVPDPISIKTDIVPEQVPKEADIVPDLAPDKDVIVPDQISEESGSVPGSVLKEADIDIVRDPVPKEEEIVPEPVSNESDIVPDPVTDQDEVAAQEEERKDRNEKMNNAISGAMKWVFLFSSILLLVVLVYFGDNVGRTEQSIRIEQDPLINLPSIAVCADDLSTVVSFLRNSSCTVGSGRKIGCTGAFQALFKREGAMCALLDNSREFGKLKARNLDLEIESPSNSSSVKFWVRGLNKTGDLDSIPATIQWWKADLTLTYRTTLYTDETKPCIEDVKSVDCKVCSEEVDSVCCPTRGLREPLVVKEESCYHFNYQMKLEGSKVPSGNKQYLRISHKGGMMIVYERRWRLTTLDIFSMVGGFIGVFLGLSMLHVLSIPPAGLLAWKRGRKTDPQPQNP